jgi:uncharacterized damage-inducible protein DinB
MSADGRTPGLAFDLAEARGILAGTPDVVERLLSGFAARWLEANEGPETFSPREVLAHLIQGERTDWIPRARLVLEHGEERPFEPFDRFAQRAWLVSRETSELVSEFRALRAASLATLAAWNLTERDLARRGRHPELGAVTLRELLATWVVHDLGHLGQIARVLAKQYGGEVGPWRAYLPVLSR